MDGYTIEPKAIANMAIVETTANQNPISRNTFMTILNA